MFSGEFMQRGPPELRGSARKSLASLKRLGLFCLALLVGAVVLSVLWQALGLPPQLQRGTVHALPLLGAGALALGLVLGVTAIFLHRLESRGLESLGLPLAPRALRAFALGLLIGALTPAFTVLAASLTTGILLEPMAGSARSLVLTTLPMATALALLSCWEEAALRGYPLQLLARAWKPSVAAVISGVTFGLLHAGNPAANLAGLAFTAAGSALLAMLVQRTGALWLAFGYHAGWNVTGAVLFGMSDSGLVHQGALLRTRLLGPAMLSGGSYGFEASLWSGLIEIIVLLLCLRVTAKLPAEPAALPWYAGTGAGSGHHATSQIGRNGEGGSVHQTVEFPSSGDGRRETFLEHSDAEAKSPHDSAG